MLKKLYALKNKKGFTLVELMVVVAIMGILVAVAVPVYNNVTDKAAKQTIATNCRTLDSTIQQYNMGAETPLAASDDAALKTALADYFQTGNFPGAPKGWVVTYAYTKDQPVVATANKTGEETTITINANGEVK